MKNRLVLFLITVALFSSVCFAEEAPFYEVILESYAYDDNCYQIPNLSLPSPVPNPSPAPPPNIDWWDDANTDIRREYLGGSALQTLENALSEYGMDAGQRQEYLAHMDHYSRYYLMGTQRIVGDGCVYIPTYTTLNYKNDIWIEVDSYRISTMEDDLEGEGEWGITFFLIVKTDGKTEGEIEGMLNTLQVEISYVTELHMDYDEEYDIEFEDYNEASRTSVLAKISSEGLIRNIEAEEKVAREAEEKNGADFVRNIEPVKPEEAGK